MKVLVIGGGGREHTIIWKLNQSQKVDKIYCAPGNGGISEIAECINIPSDKKDELVKFALENKIDLTVVGPEVPLTMGIVDEFQKNNLKCFGPNKDAALIEGSKIFSKTLMEKYDIPTAAYKEFSNPDLAKDYLKTVNFPVVVKADGLAAGKGVIIANNYNEASHGVNIIMEDKVFESAGDRIIIEEFIKGPEVSVLAFTDGKTIKPMVSSMDHKRIFDKDMGPNTGGMGTISPNPYYTKDIEEYCMGEIFIPTIEAMNREGRPYKGIIYIGLMLTDEGPKVLEYNCRFGDPETQVVLPRLKTDIVDIIEAIIDDRLSGIEIEWDDRASACVIMSSGGYPGKYEKGKIINGLDSLPKDIMIFHSGTRSDGENILTDGGRVLGITALGENLEEATKKVYGVIDKVNFEGRHYRKDIGKK